MDELNAALVLGLRHMAREGEGPSRMLRKLLDRCAPTLPHKVTLIKYMRQAFGLSLQEAAPVAGWAPDGSGELSDSQLDALLMPEIIKHRTGWEPLDMASSA